MSLNHLVPTLGEMFDTAFARFSASIRGAERTLFEEIIDIIYSRRLSEEDDKMYALFDKGFFRNYEDCIASHHDLQRLVSRFLEDRVKEINDELAVRKLYSTPFTHPAIHPAAKDLESIHSHLITAAGTRMRRHLVDGVRNAIAAHFATLGVPVPITSPSYKMAMRLGRLRAVEVSEIARELLHEFEDIINVHEEHVREWYEEENEPRIPLKTFVTAIYVWYVDTLVPRPVARPTPYGDRTDFKVYQERPVSDDPTSSDYVPPRHDSFEDEAVPVWTRRVFFDDDDYGCAAYC